MYIGLDVHKKMSYYSMVDRQGTEVKKCRFPTTQEGLNEFASTLPEGAKVAIEAQTSGIFVYEYLEVLGILGKKINEVERILREKAEVTEEAMWLMSIVGIGFPNALLALSEIGEINRRSLQ